MKESVKSLAVLLIFLMPLSAFAESWWSPNRVRVNYRIGGSSAASEQGAITGKRNALMVRTVLHMVLRTIQYWPLLKEKIKNLNAWMAVYQSITLWT